MKHFDLGSLYRIIYSIPMIFSSVYYNSMDITFSNQKGVYLFL